MDAGGNAREGWMAIIPATVLILITMYVVGGPVEFANLVQQWGTDVVTSFAHFVKHL